MEFQNELKAVDTELGVALSGGGHRATLFSLGALLYLVDSGANERVAAISSVSGGSITNAFIASRCDFTNIPREQFEKVASKLASVITSRGVLRPSSGALVYFGVLALLAVLIVSGVVWSWPLAIPWPLAVVLLVFWGFLWLLRGSVLEQLLATALSDGGSLLPCDRAKECWHIFSATDLITGRPFFFVGGPTSCTIHSCLTSEGLGDSLGGGSRVKLSAAVRASAALPGVLPPRFFKFRSDGGTVLFTFPGDGGVWNNFGTQWWDADQRIPLRDPFEHRIWRPDRVLVIDASARFKALAYDRLLLIVPWIAEFWATKRAMEILYASTLKPRRDALRQEQHARTRIDGGNYRSLVSITNRVGDYAAQVSNGGGPPIPEERKAIWTRRAEEWIEYQNRLERIDRRSLASSSAAVNTTLSRIEPSEAADLLLSGYLQTMEVMHIDHGDELIEAPSRTRFVKLMENGDN